MYVRKVRRKCSVRGCKNIDCYSVSRRREAGNTVIVCKDCLKDALAAVEEFKEIKKSAAPKGSGAPPPLFWNEAAKETALPEAVPNEAEADLSEAAPNEAEKKEAAAPHKPPQGDEHSADAFVCSCCGKSFAGEKGLKAHMRHCGQQKETDRKD